MVIPELLTTLRIIAHTANVIGFTYFAIDDHVHGLSVRSILWIVIVLERLTVLTFLAWDPNRDFWDERVSMITILLLIESIVIIYVAAERSKLSARKKEATNGPPVNNSVLDSPVGQHNARSGV
jgi:hypothetical protein